MERRNPLVRVSCWLIHLYQECAPLRIRNACRFEPTCSNYALICLREYGFWRGWWRTWGRLLRCRPPHGGVDHPVQDHMDGESVTGGLLSSERGGCSDGCGKVTGFFFIILVLAGIGWYSQHEELQEKTRQQAIESQRLAEEHREIETKKRMDSIRRRLIELSPEQTEQLKETFLGFGLAKDDLQFYFKTSNDAKIRTLLDYYAEKKRNERGFLAYVMRNWHWLLLVLVVTILALARWRRNRIGRESVGQQLLMLSADDVAYLIKHGNGWGLDMDDLKLYFRSSSDIKVRGHLELLLKDKLDTERILRKEFQTETQEGTTPTTSGETTDQDGSPTTSSMSDSAPSSPEAERAFRCSACGDFPALNEKDGKYYCNICIRTRA